MSTLEEIMAAFAGKSFNAAVDEILEKNKHVKISLIFRDNGQPVHIDIVELQYCKADAVTYNGGVYTFNFAASSKFSRTMIFDKSVVFDYDAYIQNKQAAETKPMHELLTEEEDTKLKSGDRAD